MKTDAATRGSVAVRQLRSAPKIEQARLLWRDSNYTVEQISQQVGLSRRTLYNALGPRWEDVQHV